MSFIGVWPLFHHTGVLPDSSFFFFSEQKGEKTLAPKIAALTCLYIQLSGSEWLRQFFYQF